ncbi:helix-turn-helix domain-containing protein [Mangrovibacterium sp.]|uniref:helix-turn-helix domain-containing protein n=1 Tax=Mangrovibacterium sp. TaxID=1961364 RepID=UPI0035630A65
MEKQRFSNDELVCINQRLDELTRKLEGTQRTSPDQIWYDNQEFIQIMNISKRTAAYWRAVNMVGYSQVGNKIYYRLSDILQLLAKNAIPPVESTNPKKLPNELDNDL